MLHSALVLNVALGMAAVSVLAAGHQTAHACSGAYCTDAVRPVDMSAAPVDSSTMRVGWLEHQGTTYELVDVSIRRGHSSGAETIAQLPRHLGAGYYQGHYPYTVTVTGLSFNTTYCFSVRTRGDNQTVSDWSDITCAATPYPPFSTTTPAAPAPVLIHLQGAGATGSADLTWSYRDAAGSPDYFTIKRDGNVIGSSGSHGNGDYQYTDTGPLTTGRNYSYQVCPMFGTGDIRIAGDCSNTVTVQVRPAVPSWPTVRVGMQGEVVRSLQYLLRAHDLALEVDGQFGPQTRDAVLSFQQTQGLSADGIVGPQTWSALLVTVRQSSQGPAVEAVQSQLIARGSEVALDGDFGPQTDAAVRAFQQSHGLSVDGVVGPQTWQVLLASS